MAGHGGSAYLNQVSGGRGRECRAAFIGRLANRALNRPGQCLGSRLAGQEFTAGGRTSRSERPLAIRWIGRVLALRLVWIGHGHERRLAIRAGLTPTLQKNQGTTVFEGRRPDYVCNYGIDWPQPAGSAVKRWQLISYRILVGRISRSVQKHGRIWRSVLRASR